jgi:hypothetical protein
VVLAEVYVRVLAEVYVRVLAEVYVRVLAEVYESHYPGWEEASPSAACPHSRTA